MGLDPEMELKSQSQIECDLFEQVRQRHAEWQQASEADRDVTRLRFMDALHLFNSLVLYGKIPLA
jgi:hypothetical protein